jgi:hypothetical protein
VNNGNWRLLLKYALVTALAAALFTITFAIGVAAVLGDSTEELLVEQSQRLIDASETNREVLCHAVVRPSLEAELPPYAWNRIVELCRDVGVHSDPGG